jgi:hypothetical protein
MEMLRLVDMTICKVDDALSFLRTERRKRLRLMTKRSAPLRQPEE